MRSDRREPCSSQGSHAVSDHRRGLFLGSVAAFHSSFMGATEPSHMQAAAHQLARLLTQDQGNAVCLVPV